MNNHLIFICCCFAVSFCNQLILNLSWLSTKDCSNPTLDYLKSYHLKLALSLAFTLLTFSLGLYDLKRPIKNEVPLFLFFGILGTMLAMSVQTFTMIVEGESFLKETWACKKPFNLGNSFYCLYLSVGSLYVGTFYGFYYKVTINRFLLNSTKNEIPVSTLLNVPNYHGRDFHPSWESERNRSSNASYG